MQLARAAGREPERAVDPVLLRAVGVQPGPGHEVAPVVEVEVRDRDRRRVELELPQAPEDAGPAVEEEGALALQEVPGLGAPGVRPGGGGADDGQAHLHILAHHGQEDPGRDREAGARRSRQGGEDHRAGASGRRDGGHLHGPPPDAGADRGDRDPGGRGRRRHLHPLRRAHDARAADPRRPARERGRGRARRRRRDDPARGRRRAQGAGRRRDLHAGRAGLRDRRVPQGERPGRS